MEDTEHEIHVPVAGIESAVVVTGENGAAMIERAISVPRTESAGADDDGTARGRSPGPHRSTETTLELQTMKKIRIRRRTRRTMKDGSATGSS